MYNGIGLLTPRGSGTSGYVTNNKFNLRRNPNQGPPRFDSLSSEGPKQKKANQDILEHNRKREIEAKIFALTDSLEEQGYTAEEIEREVSELRAQMEKEANEKQQDKLSMETHEVAVRKERQMDKLASAFGVSGSGEGDAFNRELQEQRKLDRIAEREQREKDKIKAEKDRKKAAKKAEKEGAKEAKRAEKQREQEEIEREEARVKRKEEIQRKVAERRAEEEEAERRAAMPPSPFSDRYSPGPEEAMDCILPSTPPPPSESKRKSRGSYRPSTIVMIDEETGEATEHTRAPSPPARRPRSPSPPPRRPPPPSSASGRHPDSRADRGRGRASPPPRRRDPSPEPLKRRREAEAKGSPPDAQRRRREPSRSPSRSSRSRSSSRSSGSSRSRSSSRSGSSRSRSRS